MKTKHQPKQSKTTFEGYLSKRISGQRGYTSDTILDWDERTGSANWLTLYYNGSGVHIGTWANGECWVYE